MIQVNNQEFLKEQYNNALRGEIYNKTSVDCCPHCNNKEFIKYGSFNGIQRYKCKKCNKTFSNATKSMYSYSKKYISDWTLFFKYMLEKKTLRFISKNVGICLTTAFLWRHKIMEALNKKIISNNLEGKVYIALGYIKENYKGFRNIKILDLPPIRDYIAIVAAYGRCDSFIAAPISRKIFLNNVFKEKIYSKISKDSYLVPYTYGMKEIALRHNNWTFLNTRVEKRIQYFNYKFEKWIKDFKGVATRYLHRYLQYYGMFIVFKKFTERDILYILSEKIYFKYTKYSVDINNKDYPFNV